MSREYRALNPLMPAQTNKRIDTTHYVEGYAATFEPYVYYTDENGEPVYEHFLREAFDSTDMSDIILQYDHAGKVYARKSNQTLIVERDDHGLFIAADLSKTEGAKTLYEEIQAGMITRMSWAFIPDEMEYDPKTRTLIHRKVRKIYDVSAVSIPANQDTEIYARAFSDGVIKKAEQEWLKREQAKRRIQLRIALEVQNEQN